MSVIKQTFVYQTQVSTVPVAVIDCCIKCHSDISAVSTYLVWFPV